MKRVVPVIKLAGIFQILVADIVVDFAEKRRKIFEFGSVVLYLLGFVVYLRHQFPNIFEKRDEFIPILLKIFEAIGLQTLKVTGDLKECQVQIRNLAEKTKGTFHYRHGVSNGFQNRASGATARQAIDVGKRFVIIFQVSRGHGWLEIL